MKPFINDFFEKIHVSNYGIMVALGLLTALVLFRVFCTKNKVEYKVYNFYSMNVLISIVVGFVCAFLFQLLYDFIKDGEIIRYGVTFMGGLIGGVAAYVIGTIGFAQPMVKREFWTVANIAAPCLVIAHSLGRVGCFFAGCCYGVKTDSWIGVSFEGVSGKRIPTQLIEAIFLALLFIALIIIMLKFKKTNILLLVYMYAYSIFRFTIEFWRGDDRGAFVGGLSPSQFQSIVLFLAAVALTILIYKYKIIPFAKAGLKSENNITISNDELISQNDEISPQEPLDESISNIDKDKKNE